MFITQFIALKSEPKFSQWSYLFPVVKRGVAQGLASESVYRAQPLPRGAVIKVRGDIFIVVQRDSDDIVKLVSDKGLSGTILIGTLKKNLRALGRDGLAFVLDTIIDIGPA